MEYQNSLIQVFITKHITGKQERAFRFSLSLVVSHLKLLKNFTNFTVTVI